MAAQRIIYTCVGRYMDGKNVVGYHLTANDGSKSRRYTREQLCYLVGRGQVSNVSGQIYEDKVLIRGVGIDLDSLPVEQVSGEISRTENLGRIKKGATNQDVMNMFMVVSAIKEGRNVTGYVIRNAGGQTFKVPRDKCIELAAAGRIGNARIQKCNGETILRGIGTNLNQIQNRQQA